MRRLDCFTLFLIVPILLFSLPAEASTLSGLVGNGIIHLRWTQNTEPGLEGYRVFYGTASGVYDGTSADQGTSPITVPVAGFSDPANPEFSLTSLSNGVPHYFLVKAVVSGMETDESNEISLTPAGWPAQLTASNPFQNPGFEDDFAVWNCQWSSATINSYIDTNIKLFGSKSLKVVSTNTTPGVYQISGWPYQDPATQANTDYIVSLWVKAENAHGACFVVIVNMDQGWDKRFGVLNGMYPWTRVSYIYNTGPYNESLVALVGEMNGTVWIDGIEMVKLSEAGLGPPYPQTFTRYVGNPVLDLGDPGSLDDAYVYGPTVLEEPGGDYRMYYTMHDGTNTRIGLATSPDGTDWTKYGENPVLNLGGTFDNTHIQPSSILTIGPTYHLYYNGHDGSKYQIGHATSDDGIAWTRDPANPVLTVGDEGPFTSTHVFAPSVLLEGETYKMWYHAYDGVQYHIAYATSPDGSTFTRQGVVLSPGGLGEIDITHCAYPRVMKNPDGTYTMWYSGYGPNWYTICHAESIDGVAWTPVGSDLSPTYSSGFDFRSIFLGSVLAGDSALQMWYGGYSVDSVWRIGLAEQTYTPTPTPTNTATPTETPTSPATPTATPPSGPTPFPADINEDGVVDYKDALILQQQWHWSQDL